MFRSLFRTEKTSVPVLNRFYVVAAVTTRYRGELITREVTRVFYYGTPTLGEAERAVRREFRFAIAVYIVESGRL